MSKPSVILGTESWLDGNDRDCDVFPSNYVSYRKDRDCHGGGVFILVDQNIQSQMLRKSDDSTEAVWVQLRLKNGKSLAVCSFYRPPGSKVQVLTKLVEDVEVRNYDSLVIGGDFNLPEINWLQNATIPNVSSASAKELMKLHNSFALSQLVCQPTRGSNVLDLLFTNLPVDTQPVLILPGISDHNAVLCKLKLEYIKVANSAGRRIYSYRKAQVDEISLALDSYYDVFETLSESLNVDELWCLLKKKIFELRDQFVPSWVMTARRLEVSHGSRGKFVGHWEKK